MIQVRLGRVRLWLFGFKLHRLVVWVWGVQAGWTLGALAGLSAVAGRLPSTGKADQGRALAVSVARLTKYTDLVERDGGARDSRVPERITERGCPEQTA
jgi:hypothetical protein